MFKILVERPRFVHRYKGQTRKKVNTRAFLNDLDEDLLPFGVKQSIRPKGKFQFRKELNENLQPLWRFLKQRCGCLWEDVYSELRRNLDPKNAVQMHLMQHIKLNIVMDTILGSDRRVYSQRKHTIYRSDQCLETSTMFRDQFYIHPVTHILCMSPFKRDRVIPPEKAKKLKFQVSPVVQYRLIQGTWYVVELEEIPKDLGSPTEFFTNGTGYKNNREYMKVIDFTKVGDVLFPGGLNSAARTFEYGFSDLRAISLRTMGRREEKHLKDLLKPL